MTTKTKAEKTHQLATQKKQELAGAESTRPGRFFTPAVDIYETESALIVLADMPGVAADGLTIDLRDNTLTIEGAVDEEPGTNERILVREYETGGFRREFRLSSAIDQKKIDARLTDGVLCLTLPKAEAAKPRKIEVRTD